jgi:hypothetical protein
MKKRAKIASARKLRSMKRKGQARDRALAAKRGGDDSWFLISPKDARSAKVIWPDVDLY